MTDKDPQVIQTLEIADKIFKIVVISEFKKI